MTRHWENPALVAASLVGIPTPSSLDEMAALECAEGIVALPIQHDNSDIAVSESALYPSEAQP